MSWLPVVVTVDPLSEPVSLTEAKAQCRVDGTDSDELLTSYISIARTLVEQSTGSKLVTQTVSLKCNDWCDLAQLPVAPIQSVTSIQYLDVNGALQTLDTSVYETSLVGLSAAIRPQINLWWPPIRSWNADDAIRVTAVAGYSTVPPPLKAAMLMLIAQWYDERTSISSVRQSVTPDGGIPTLPNTVDALLANYRKF